MYSKRISRLLVVVVVTTLSTICVCISAAAATTPQLFTVTAVSYGIKPTSHMKTEKIFRLYLFSSSFFRNILPRNIPTRFR